MSMMKKYLIIQEASEIIGKSIQTIRRAVRAKKVLYKKQKTAQGFIYLIEKDSLLSHFKINIEPAITKSPRVRISASKSDKHYITSEDFKHLTETLEKMVSSHGEERQNFMRLITTLQEKIFVLENQLNLLQSPAKKWYQFWK